MAHDDGVRAAAGGLRDQRAEPQLRRVAKRQLMRAQHSGGESGEAGGGHRQLLGEQGGQVREVQADAAASIAGIAAADRRVLRQPRMPGGR